MSMNSNMSMFNNKLSNNKVFKVAGKSFQNFVMGHCKHFSSVHATVGMSKKTAHWTRHYHFRDTIGYHWKVTIETVWPA